MYGFPLLFCFSLSSNSCRLFISRKHKVASVGLAPLKVMKRGALSTPRSARPRSSPPLNREEVKRPHEVWGQETGQTTPDPQTREAEVPRPQELEETV